MEHTKTHHTKTGSHRTHRAVVSAVLYLTDDNKTYAIPKKIAEKYIVDTKKINNAVSSNTVFEKLEKKLTSAGALLKGLRTRENMSQIDFAKKMGVTQANLSKMENGHRAIGKIIAKRIEKAFGVNYRYFLS